MIECYYYIEEIPGVELEDCYIRPMCVDCHWKNMTQGAWNYYGLLPPREVKCNICNKVIHDGSVNSEADSV